MKEPRPIVLAAGAHPDDIEFMMAGTLLRLKDAGCEIHYWNVLSGSMGTGHYSARKAARVRTAEAKAAAALAGAEFHPPLFGDLDGYYEARRLARVAAVVRRIQPNLVLLQSPQDYMEDHQNVVRLLVTALFTRGMRNMRSLPHRAPYAADCAVYHALPHGLRDGLGKRVRPECYVEVSPFIDRKKEMLACHRSQASWLDESQGMHQYLDTLVSLAREVGRMSGKFKYAEGWRKRSHLGFGPENFDPLCRILGSACRRDAVYAREKENGFKERP